MCVSAQATFSGAWYLPAGSYDNGTYADDLHVGKIAPELVISGFRECILAALLCCY